ncbi:MULTISPECIES: class I SAM-dependent methyltransferase [Prauserella salsuginis group]|uniref:Class I SAM-dependent methyltransferase n=1 Tax=Prauserella salsuginis TaxID=387889 RepID=A0ABW6G3A2_9PSEU|nr:MULTISPECIES: class I SAM-dependent methyltransferase [Prauserella salsuginis group]MCR3718525.1 Methyltransferase domain-containing protein [Prauserella flava]MCR3733095.1 Methyltransferase domain-containing protein [Prauserella salsuginis]
MRTEYAAGHGSPAVRRVLVDELAQARERRSGRPRVIDVGGGTGGWAVPLAGQGCDVTVVEPNPDAVATLRRRAREVGADERITVVADDVDGLAHRVPEGSADLVLAHGLLEVVDDPAAAVRAFAAVTAPGGAVSVLVANRHAAVLHRALAGRLSEATALLTAPDGVLSGDSETVLRRFDTSGLEMLLGGAGLAVALMQGDGVVADVVHQLDAGDDGADAAREREITEFEDLAAVTPPLRDIASRLHVLARRPG